MKYGATREDLCKIVFTTIFFIVLFTMLFFAFSKCRNENKEIKIKNIYAKQIGVVTLRKRDINSYNDKNIDVYEFVINNKTFLCFDSRNEKTIIKIKENE